MSADRFQNLLVRWMPLQRSSTSCSLPPAELAAPTVAVQILELLDDVRHGDTVTHYEELNNLIGKVSPCCGVTLLADDLGDLSLTSVGHRLIARKCVPEVLLDPVGQTWFIASSHDFLSGLPSLLMVRDDFRHMEVNSTLVVRFCQEVSGTVIR